MDFIEENDRIYLKDNSDKIIAEITFNKIADDTYNIDHTFVDGTLRGKGIASQLVEKAVNKIKKEGCKVEATCSYAKMWLEKQEY